MDAVITELAEIRCRRARSGPETDLVDRFLRSLRVRASVGMRVTVFREPRLATGFPDVVAVKWHETTTSRWLAARARLRTEHIRLLHFLATTGPVDELQLRMFATSQPRQALQQLANLHLVTHARGRWRAAPLREVFAVRSILAFEAKMSDWSAAVDQAALNRWFASESYVLAPAGRDRSSLIEAAAARGVGVWLDGARRPVLPATRSESKQPVSYASWLFNEWAWRSSLVHSRGDGQ